MRKGQLLVDSDAFLLFAGAGLLERAVGLAGFPPDATYRLAALPHMISGSRSLERKYPLETRQRALLACSRFPALGDRPSDEMFQLLLDIPQVDSGEALLYALLAERPSCYLLSGDKRAMVQVASSPNAAPVRTAVAGRVIPIEVLLKSLIQSDGVQMTASRFRDLLTSHETLQVVFSAGNLAEANQCRAALDSYMADLRLEVGPGFLMEDP